MSGDQRLTCPDQNEFEFSLFGPRYGESAVIHYGSGHWMIVDSCLADSGQPAALEYLSSINVDFEKNVRAVCCTHFDEDHIRGLAEILRQCPESKFIVSQALQKKEFQEVLRLGKGLNNSRRTGLRELRSCIEIVKTRPAPFNALMPAIANKRVFTEWVDDKNKSSPPLVAVDALAPSEMQVEKCLQQLAAADDDPVKLASEFKRNDLSTVLLIATPEVSVLHGGDLESNTTIGTGWEALLDDPNRGATRSPFYKIAHHGSHSGDHDRIWTDLLDPTAISALAPFRKGRHRIPTADDVKRMTGKRRDIFSTSQNSRKRKRATDQTVRTTLRESEVKLYDAAGQPGQVRIRCSPGKAPKVDLFGDACRIQNINCDY